MNYRKLTSSSMRTKTVLGMVFIIFLCVFTVPPLEAQAPDTTRDSTHARFSITFRDADMLNVLRLLAKQHQLNLIASNEVRGKITVHFSDVTLEEALEVILKANGYDYYIEDKIIFVKPIEMERSTQWKTKIYNLKYVDAVDMKELINPFLSKKGKAETLNRMLSGHNLEKRSSVLMVYDLASRIESIDSVIHHVDQPVPQILIEVRMYETSIGGEKKTGVGLPTAITGSTIDARNPSDPTQKTDFTLVAPLEDRLHNIIMGKLTVDRLIFSLNFLKTETQSKLLSNPKIITLDNQTAEISVGTIIPVQTISRSASGDIISFTDKNVDVKLRVTPKVNPDSMLTLLIEPTIEDIIGYVGSGDNRQPIISKRTAKTQVMIRHGESIVIGGMIKENEVELKEKVWLLGDIPFLGRLFTKTSKERKKSDLLIFITPKILEGSYAGVK